MIPWCTVYFNFTSLPFLASNTNIELQNFRPYSVSVVAPLPSCTSSQNDTAHVAMSRNQACPPGMGLGTYGINYVDGVAYSAQYCRGDNETKDLGQSCSLIKNPINAATGNKFQLERDYIGAGDQPLRFERFYNSAGTRFAQTLNFGPAWAARIGLHWRHTYDRSITLVESATLTTAFVYRPDGKAHPFNFYNDLYYPDRDISSRLLRLADGSGNPTGWEYRNAEDDSIEVYDVNGRLISITSLGGLAQTLLYDGAGRLSTVTDAFGRQLTFSYDANNRIETMTDPAGGQYLYGYDAGNNLATVTRPGSQPRTYLYNEVAHTSGTSLPHALTGIIDENSQRFATYKYDSLGRATFTEHAGGAEVATLAYNANGTTTVTDALGTARNYGYQTILGVRKTTSLSQPCTDCGGSVASTGYDANGNATAKTDFNGNQTTYLYDLARNLETSRTEAFGTPRARTITTIWHPTFRLPTQIDEPNRRTTFGYDANGNLLTRTITNLATSQTRAWTFTYNAVGQVLTANGPRLDVNDITTYAYYSCSTGYQCGQVQTITNALNHVTTFNTYNAHGQPLTITDPNGLVTTLTYDARQRLTSREVGGESTAVTYYPTGLVRRVTLPDGTFIENTYDGAHRLTAITDGAGNRIAYTLDAMGNRTAENTYDPSNALSLTRSRVYNTLNRLTQEIGAANQTTVSTYDGNGNLDTVTDPRNRVTNHDYDELNRLIRVTDPALGLTQYGYDANDNLTNVSDPRTLATSYTFNGFGDLTQLASPDTGITQYTPDAAGNVDLAIDARNRSADYSYDVLNRASQILYSDQTVAFEYDQGANARGRLTRVTDVSGNTQWTFNAQGRVASKQQTIGTLVRTVSYGYSTVGQLNQITTPSGQVIGYGYTNQRVTSVTLNGAALLSQVLYEPFGPTRGWSWANGTLTVRDYDTDWQLTTLDSAGLSTFTFFADGLIQTRTDDAPTTFGLPTGTTNYTPATLSNRLASSTGTQSRTYGFDAAGNTTSYTGATFIYNDAGRMGSATAGGVTTSYLVNGLGQRVRKSNAATTRLFVYDESGHLLGEYDQAGALVQETVWLQDIPVATLRPNGGSVSIFYVHTDHLNTPRKVTRPSDSAILWRWESDPFGQALVNEDVDGDGQSFNYNLRFPGQYFDSETGLSYNYFRDYDPQIGRYPQSDPIGLAGGLNTYGYVLGNPVMNYDSNGLEIICGNNFCGSKIPAFPPVPVPPGPSGGRSSAQDYCGSGWIGGFPPDSFRGGLVDFRDACKSHDRCYAKCGANKSACDRSFLQDMRSRCLDTYNSGGLHFGLADCVQRARWYYWGVRTRFGDDAFDRAQRDCSCTPP